MAPRKALAMGLPKAAGLVMTRQYSRRFVPVKYRVVGTTHNPERLVSSDRYQFLTRAAQAADVRVNKQHAVRLCRVEKNKRKNARKLIAAQQSAGLGDVDEEELPGSSSNKDQRISKKQKAQQIEASDDGDGDGGYQSSSGLQRREAKARDRQRLFEQPPRKRS